VPGFITPNQGVRDLTIESNDEDGDDKQNTTKGKRKSLQGKRKASASEVIDIDAVNSNENDVDKDVAASDKRKRVQEGKGKDSASKVIDIDAANSGEDGEADPTVNDQGADDENDRDGGAYKEEPGKLEDEATSERSQRPKRKSTPDKAINVDGAAKNNDDDTNRIDNRTEDTVDTPLSTSSPRSNGRRRGQTTGLQREKIPGSSTKAALDLSQETAVPGTPKREKDVKSEVASTPGSHSKRRRKTSPKKPATKGRLVNLTDDEFTFLG
jgi:hypothetical protein